MGRREELRKIHWIGWKTLCKPKCYGGLGFRDLELFNKAMLAKQGWRIINNPSSLLAHVLKGRYFKNCDFMSAKIGWKPSYIWRSLLWGREILEDGIRWRINNGEKVQIYGDNWVPNKPTLKILSDHKLLVTTTVSFFISDIGQWKADLVHSLFAVDEARCILSLPLLSGREGDRLI